MSSNISDYQHIPGFSDIPQTEMSFYFSRLAPEAVAANEKSGSAVNLDLFW